jgi:hypothetical protein
MKPYDRLPRPPMAEEDVAAFMERALAQFDSLDWHEVPERGVWEAEFEGEVLQCPASTDPAGNTPDPEEMIPATICAHCCGYFPVELRQCPTCGAEF